MALAGLGDELSGAGQPGTFHTHKGDGRVCGAARQSVASR